MFSQSKRAKMNAAESTSGQKEANASSVIAEGVSASVNALLHPLVIMNLSDHWTRVKAQTEAPNPVVIGAILGKRTGRSVELFNSFELMFAEVEGAIVIDMEYFKMKVEQFGQVFKDLDFLGWYSLGGENCSSPSERDIVTHKQFLDANESALFLKLDPVSKSSKLPVLLNEHVIDIIEQQPRMLFIDVPFTLVTEEAERIGVDHVTRLSSAGSSNKSQVAEYINVQRSAVQMLHSRIQIILAYIKAVQAGEIETNHEIMRNCMSLCQRLPVINSKQFQGDFVEQCNDVSLMAYLAQLTKGCNAANELIRKFNLAYDRQGAGRRMRPLFTCNA